MSLSRYTGIEGLEGSMTAYTVELTFCPSPTGFRVTTLLSDGTSSSYEGRNVPELALMAGERVRDAGFNIGMVWYSKLGVQTEAPDWVRAMVEAA